MGVVKIAIVATKSKNNNIRLLLRHGENVEKHAYVKRSSAVDVEESAISGIGENRRKSASAIMKAAAKAGNISYQRKSQ